MTSMRETTAAELLGDAIQDEGFAAEYEKNRLRLVLSEALFRLRKSLGLTQTTLAQRVGWRQPYVARLEGNPSESAAAMERLEKFANACGASTVLLFVDQRTGTIRESVAVGPKQSLREVAAQWVGTPVSSIEESGARIELEEMQAVVSAVEETSVALGAATQRLRSQLEAIREHEAHAPLGG
ncbi:helix-turn-helix domain-containing protein [Variovorax sp. RT4R15]|uniref:helix-turn-helix domain-containing protein n=1 Tax=Variovorax sp. RT4R15 TaxID=3443737 RepID=UPI003F46A6DC